MSWLSSSPERRRLRFSFQIYNVKDPTGSPAPPFSARWRREAAFYLAAPLVSTARFCFSERPKFPKKPPILRDKTSHPGKPRHPSRSLTESIEAAEHTHRYRNCKGRNPLPSLAARAVRSRGAFYGVPALLATPLTQILRRTPAPWRSRVAPMSPIGLATGARLTRIRPLSNLEQARRSGRSASSTSSAAAG